MCDLEESKYLIYPHIEEEISSEKRIYFKFILKDKLLDRRGVCISEIGRLSMEIKSYLNWDRMIENIPPPIVSTIIEQFWYSNQVTGITT